MTFNNLFDNQKLTILLGRKVTPPFILTFTDSVKSVELPHNILSSCCGELNLEVDFRPVLDSGSLDVSDVEGSFFKVPIRIQIQETINER